MKLYCLQCKQFPLVDSVLFGQVRGAVFSGVVEIFSGKNGSVPPRKNWPLTPMQPSGLPNGMQAWTALSIFLTVRPVWAFIEI